MTDSERLARIEATVDALVAAANAPTTDEEFRYNQEAQRIWNAPPALREPITFSDAAVEAALNIWRARWDGGINGLMRAALEAAIAVHNKERE